MKVILSRKGFDSGSGGAASPVFEDGSILSLPIPDRRSRYSYGDIGADGLMGRLVEDLSKGRTRARSPAHLDPDIDAFSLPRLPGWRGAFGQTGSARTHLDRCGVGPGDVFLFFGWFRDVAMDTDGRWVFAPRRRSVHALFGWLQVGEVVPLPRGTLDEWAHVPWLQGHPHVSRGPEERNAVYVAAERLVMPGLGDTGLPGYGTIKKLSPGTMLTAEGARSRSLWRLPQWFAPSSGRACLSYHGSPERWTLDGGDVLLSSVGRGQEFVLDCKDRSAAADWVAQTVSS